MKRKLLNIFELNAISFINLHFTIGARKYDHIQLHTAYIFGCCVRWKIPSVGNFNYYRFLVLYFPFCEMWELLCSQPRKCGHKIQVLFFKFIFIYFLLIFSYRATTNFYHYAVYICIFFVSVIFGVSFLRHDAKNNEFWRNLTSILISIPWSNNMSPKINKLGKYLFRWFRS